MRKLYLIYEDWIGRKEIQLPVSLYDGKGKEIVRIEKSSWQQLELPFLSGRKTKRVDATLAQKRRYLDFPLVFTSSGA